MTEASGPSAPPGWYPVGDGSTETYWNGTSWTNATRPAQPPEAASSPITVNKRVIGWVTIVAGVIGGAIACFTEVSLISGTGTVWVGFVVAALALVVAAVVKVGKRFVITLSLVVALSLAVAIYDEVQLAHKRDQLTHLFDD